MNLPRNKGPIYYVVFTIWVQLIGVIAYLVVSYYYPDLQYSPFIIAGLALINICVMIFLKPYGDILRSLFNQLIVFIVFLCYFMIREVD